MFASMSIQRVFIKSYSICKQGMSIQRAFTKFYSLRKLRMSIQRVFIKSYDLCKLRMSIQGAFIKPYFLCKLRLSIYRVSIKSCSLCKLRMSIHQVIKSFRVVRCVKSGQKSRTRLLWIDASDYPKYFITFSRRGSFSSKIQRVFLTSWAFDYLLFSLIYPCNMHQSPSTVQTSSSIVSLFCVFGIFSNLFDIIESSASVIASFARHSHCSILSMRTCLVRCIIMLLVSAFRCFVLGYILQD